jgi:fructokinase
MMRVGIEMGGTKCVCTLGTGPEDIRAQQVFPTRDPETTLAGVTELIDHWQRDFGEPVSIGIGAFGPLDLRRDSPNYGRIGATTKERGVILTCWAISGSTMTFQLD